MFRKAIFIGLLLIVIGLAIEAPTITYPNNNYKNSGTYTVTWTSVEGANCYKLMEIESGTPYIYETTSSDQFEKSDGKYTYKVQASDEGICPPTFWEDNWSDPKYIIVDTEDPSVIDHTPTGNDVPLNTQITVTFDEEMNKSATEEAFFTLPQISGTESWSGNKLILTPDSNLDEGETYTAKVSNAAKDLAGNTLSMYEWSFTTTVYATDVNITSPHDGDDFIQGDSITIQAVVTGVDGKSVIGATVTSSGACSATLSDKGGGTYEGTCVISDWGDLTLTVTATKVNTVTDSITLNVEKSVGLNIDVLEPSEFTFNRGDTVTIKVKVTADNIPVNDASVSAASLAFTNNNDGTYSATLETNYQTLEDYSITVFASAVIGDQSKSMTKVLSFTFNPANLDVDVDILENGVVSTSVDAGGLISVRGTVRYPNGTLADLSASRVSGSLVITSSAGIETKDLVFTRESVGVFVTDEVYTVKNIDSNLQASVSAEDSYGNSGSKTKNVHGPTLGLRFNVITPIVWTFSPGQVLHIEAHVYSEEEKKNVIGATVKLNNFSFTEVSGVYSIDYAIMSTETRSEIDLLVEMNYRGSLYYETQKVFLSRELSVSLAENATEVVRGRNITLLIAYPNGDPVTSGNFVLTLSNGENYALNLSRAVNFYTVALPDFGDYETGLQFSVSGDDGLGNSLSMSFSATYLPAAGVLEWIKAYWYFVIGAIAVVCVTGFVGFRYITHSSGMKEFKEIVKGLEVPYNEDMRVWTAFYNRTIQDIGEVKRKSVDSRKKMKQQRTKFLDLRQRHGFMESIYQDYAKKKIKEGIMMGVKQDLTLTLVTSLGYDATAARALYKLVHKEMMDEIKGTLAKTSETEVKKKLVSMGWDASIASNFIKEVGEEPFKIIEQLKMKGVSEADIKKSLIEWGISPDMAEKLIKGKE